MSGTLTLLPTGNAVQFRGNWTTSSTAVSLTTAVNDASDSTYVRLNASYTSYQYGASIWWPMAGQSLPPGARVTSAYSQVRAAKTAGTPRAVATNLFESALTPGNQAKAQYLPRGWNAQAIGTTIGDKQGRPATQTVRGTLIDQTVINNMWVEGLYFTQTDTRIYEARAIINYDEKPTATILAPTGTVTDEGLPLVVWDYLDDLQPQAKYQVQIYGSGGALAYDSGAVISSNGFHEIASTLADDTYTIKLRVAQSWTGPGGDFWGDYVSGAFTLLVSRPSSPTLTATADSSTGRITVQAQHNLNLLSYDLASQEYGPEGLYIYSGATVTPSKSSVDKRSGTYSTLLTIVGSPGADVLVVRTGLRTANVEGSDGTTMSFRAYMKAAAGAATNSWIAGLLFYDAADTLLGFFAGTATPVTTAGWVAVTVEAAVPVGSHHAAVAVLDHSAGTAGHGYYMDDLYLHYGTVASMETANLRGGFFDPGTNELSWDDSSFENNMTNWMADNANTVVDISATTAIHGVLALRTTRTGSTGQVQIRLRDYGPYFDVTPGKSYRATVQVKSSGTARTIRQVIRFYDSNLTVVASATTTVSDSSSGWTILDNGTSAVVPANAVRASVFYEADNVVVGEFHYFDMFFVSWDDPVSVILFSTIWEPGFRLIDGPFMTVEWSEDSGVNWSELTTRTLEDSTGTETIYDYECKTGVDRIYRAFNWRVSDGKTFQSALSSSTVATHVTLTTAWVHSDDDPSGTILQLSYDGTGRSDSPDNLETSNIFAGRTYPQSVFGEGAKRSLTVSATLPDTVSQTKMLALSQKKSMVVFRDKRGRRVRGVITSLTFSDEMYGQEVSLTVEVRGDQW